MRKTTVSNSLKLALAWFFGLALCAFETHAATTTVLQWSFTQTSGTVTAPVADTSGFSPAHPASDLVDDNGPLNYSSDIPTNTQFCTGTGSVDCTGVSTALSSANSMGIGSGQGIVTAEQVAAAGGLTMEVWIKNPVAIGTPAAALNMGGMYLLGVDASGNVGFWHGDDTTDGSWTTPAPNAGEWVHLAVVMKTTDPAALAYSDISAYLDGTNPT